MFVYKYEKFKFDQPFLSFQLKHIFIRKSKVCNDRSDFDGNTVSLEGEDNEYVYFSGLEILKFKTDDKNIDYISLLGNNMCPYTFAIRKNIHISYQLITNILKMIKQNKELY